MNNFKMILLLLVCFSCQKEQKTKNQDQMTRPAHINIYAIGDSTMADKPNPENNPERGWVQMLPEFLTDEATVFNHAVNGRSTRSFIQEHRWDSVVAKLQEGDYVFIQYGHNDQKIEDPERYTNPHTAYRHNLIQFIEDARAKRAIPVLFTSIVRRDFNEQGTLVDSHGAYPVETRLVAQEYKVPLIDLQYLTEQLEEAYGVENSKKLHLHYLPQEHTFYPEGKTDDTHLSVLGATEVAKLAVKALKNTIPEMSDLFIP